MRLIYLTFLAAFVWAAALGCARDDRHSMDGPTVIPPNWRREHDRAFSKWDRELIRAARRVVEKSEGRPVDGYYQVHRTRGGGYYVSVVRVESYKDGHPEFRMSSDRTVEFREDGSLVGISGGL